MNICLKRIFIVLVLCASIAPGFAQTNTDADDFDASDDVDKAGGSSMLRHNNAENAATDGQGTRTVLRDLDAIMEEAMRQYAVPGAAIAVAYQGRLVYAKGYGVANIGSGEPVTPSTLFNLGSCTKAVSMFGTLRLQEARRLNLDDTVYNVIGHPPLPKNRVDPRVFQITVRQLLHHSGGWNDDSGFVKASNEINRIAPKGMPYREAVRYLFMTPLDYTPGSKAKYANGQWNLVKFVISNAAQMPYGEFLRRELATIGITDMHNESQQNLPGESARYGGKPPRMLPSGQRDVALMPTFGNWMASAVDMAKFLTALDGSRIGGITQESFEQMIAPLPLPMVNDKDGSHFGLGMDCVRQRPNGVFFTKNGAKPGVHAQIQHLASGVDFVVLMNGGANDDGSIADPMPLGKIARVLKGIAEWPQHNLFERFQ